MTDSMIDSLVRIITKHALRLMSRSNKRVSTLKLRPFSELVLGTGTLFRYVTNHPGRLDLLPSVGL